jgi:oleate hydratase
MEAVYSLLNVDRGVPEVFNSVYDVRVLLDSTVKLMDGKKPLETMKLTLPQKIASRLLLRKIRGTVIEELLQRYNVI